MKEARNGHPYKWALVGGVLFAILNLMRLLYFGGISVWYALILSVGFGALFGLLLAFVSPKLHKRFRKT